MDSSLGVEKETPSSPERATPPLRPASAGCPWRNPGRFRMRDIHDLKASARSARPSRPSSAPSNSARVLLAEGPSAKEILSKAYSERVDCGLLQYKMKFGLKSPKSNDKEELEQTELCSTPGHMATLRKDVYMAKCDELHVKANSGILAWLAGTESCICQQEGGNFRNMLLGNRGILGVLPLLDSMGGLKTLSLVGNGLRDAGAKALLSSLRAKEHLPQLSVFDLSQNPLSSTSADGLEPLLSSRRRLLLLGLASTALSCTQRQKMIRQSLAKFENAEADEALETWRLAATSGFADPELQAHCAAHAEALRAAAQPIPAPPQHPPGPGPHSRRKAAAFSTAKVAAMPCTSHCKCSKCNGYPSPAQVPAS